MVSIKSCRNSPKLVSNLLMSPNASDLMLISWFFYYFLKKREWMYVLIRMLPLFLKQEALCLCVEGTLSQMAEAALEEIVVVEYFVLDLIDKILAGLDGLSLSI